MWTLLNVVAKKTVLKARYSDCVDPRQTKRDYSGNYERRLFTPILSKIRLPLILEFSSTVTKTCL